MGKSKSVRLQVAEIAPTQPCIGRFEVQLKADRFRLMTPSDIEGYLEEKRDKDKAVRVVRGRARFFLIDGHHTLSALIESHAPRELELDMVEDYSDTKDASEFWDRMKKEGLLYPHRLGVPIEPSDFPADMTGLQDDPFRSLSWLLRKMDAFEDLKQPYQEFRVADFLRAHMAFQPHALYEYELAAVRGFELLRSEPAKAAVKDGALPGVDADEKLPDDLLDRYYSVLEKARAPRIYR